MNREKIGSFLGLEECDRIKSRYIKTTYSRKTIRILLLITEDMMLRQFESALKGVNELIRMHPDKSVFRFKRIEILLEMGNLKTARKEVGSYLKNEPETSAIYALCLCFEVMILQKEGKIDKARNRIDEVIAHIKKKLSEETEEQKIDKRNLLENSRKIKEELDRL